MSSLLLEEAELSWKAACLIRVLCSVQCHIIRISSHCPNDVAFVPAQVECSDRDLHSGVYGGSVHEAMTDLISLMGERRLSALCVLSGLALCRSGRRAGYLFEALCAHACVSILHEHTQPCF